MNKYTYKITPKSRIGKSIATLMSGTVVAQGVTIVTMPVVTRLYTPDMIGVISVYLSFFGFWSILLAWRYENALLITKNEDESRHVFRLGAVLTFVMALIAIPVLGGLQYGGILGFDVLPTSAPAIAFTSLLGFGWFRLHRSWLLRLGEVRLISLSTVARSSVNAGTRVIAGALGLAVYGLFAADIIGSWCALTAARKKNKKLAGERKHPWSIKNLKRAAIRYKNFALFEMPSAAINQLSIALPVPIIGALYGAEAAGWFGLARLLYGIPNGQLGRAAGDVFQMELGRCVRGGEMAKGQKLFYQFSIRLALVGLVPTVLAIFVAPPLVPYIFGAEWKEMGAIAAGIAPWMYMNLILSGMSRALSVLEKQTWKLVYDIFALLVVCVCYYISERNGIDLFSFIHFLTWGMFLAYLLYFILISIVIRRAVSKERIVRDIK